MNKNGVISKSQKELYYVIADGLEYKAKARGVFRERKIKPLVGDKVSIQVLDDGTAYIEQVFERKNSLVRPPIANIDQIILVSSLSQPKLNYTIFDKYLVMLEHYSIPVKLVINKIDLASKKEIEEFKSIYDKTPYNYLFTSSVTGQGINELEGMLRDSISSFAGPSGVGKSTILNLLADHIDAETGDVSRKTSRGKHTTRHVEIFELEKDTYIFDTPGFTSLDLSFIDEYRDVKEYFPEFVENSKTCKFANCQHVNEPGCQIKKMMEEDKISKSRYDNYLYIREELMKIRRY